MKVLITGASGQLGRTLAAEAPDNVSIIAPPRSDLDISDEQQVMAVVRRVSPDVVVNAAAFTNVDQAESNEDAAVAVNSSGARNIALSVKSTGTRLLHISTDFVFDGMSSTPYKPGDDTGPQSRYGQSKLGAELAVNDVLGDKALILRTAWLYSQYNSNFVTTMLTLMRSRADISVVEDQIGSPTWATSLAQAIYRFIEKPALGGIWHWADAGSTSWYEFAVAIKEEALKVKLLDSEVRIHPCTTEDYGAPAPRPAYSVLDVSKTEQEFGVPATHWRENLRSMLHTRVNL
ncbi:MAG: dTDP-4-dehydrorhamnose reductase [Pseudomonadota bacterium]